MGLLNKLKNVLFEEEIEVPENTKELEKEKVVLKKKEPVKMTFQDEEEETISDRELFKAEPTFNFPMFDEKEFEEVKKEEKPEIPIRERTEMKPKPKTPTVFDIEKGRSKSYHDEYERPYKPERKVERNVTPIEQRKFKPSPVISPVYGVLDKNYKKEDIVVKGEEKKIIDVDSVRRKAFGTLEDDIEKTLTTPTRKFYEEPIKEEKAIDDLLKDTVDEIIPVNDEYEETEKDFMSFNIEEEPIKENDTLEVLDKKKTKVEEDLLDETLENDLFDLIDSMYENREDGE